MSRGLSTAAKNYTGAVRWALKITLRDATVLNLSEDEITFLGTAYKPYLRGAGPFTFTKSQQSDNGEIELLNADGFISAQLEAKNIAWAKCEVKLLLLGIEEEVTLLVGKLTDPQLSRETVSFRVIGQLDPAGLRVPLRDFTVECPWKFGSPEDGYDRATLAVTENLAQRTATSVQDDGITDSTLAMTVNEHADRECFVTEGTTGKGQVKRIKSNTATALVFYGPWVTKPTGTVKFKVFTLAQGAPKPLTTSTAAKLSTTATGGAARYIEDTGLALVADEHLGDWVKILVGTGSGQLKRVGSNTAGGRFTLDAAETDFAPVPDGTSVFAALYNTCTKDFAACAARARIHRFAGFPTLTQAINTAAAGSPGVVGSGGGGGGGGGGEDDGRGRMVT